ncbi:hypothetical protein P5G61_10320, partial [Paenibacillus sp. F6_3S_P_1C]|nr:hypothetical protein [Paenibacillus vandeheii]
TKMLGLENRSRIFHRGTVALGLTICHLETIKKIGDTNMIKYRYTIEYKEDFNEVIVELRHRFIVKEWLSD